MRFLNAVLLAAMLLACARAAAARAPELVTVAAEGMAVAQGENYAAAREEAVNMAFISAARMAVAGVMSPEDAAERADAIEQIARRGADFVKSYKFLEEAVDHVSGAVTVRLQVTLFLDTIRAAVKDAGVRAKKRALPKLLVLIDERGGGFLPEGDFLMLNSQSEEELAGALRERGFAVADRRDIRGSGLEGRALDMARGDKAAARELAAAFDADLVVFGKARVNASPSGKGEMVETVITASILPASGGEELIKREESAGGLFGDVLAGSRETTREAARALAGDLSMDIKNGWRKIKELDYDE